jgi:hypothetical protein
MTTINQMLDTISNFGLERGYYLAQIILLFVAIVAAAAGFVQVRTIRLFELLKFLEESSVRDARRPIFKEVKLGDTEKWWETNLKLDEAASTVCATYDIVSHLAMGKNRRFFVREWANSICWTHERLENFLKDRRRTVPSAYHAYSALYKEAIRHDPRVKK